MTEPYDYDMLFDTPEQVASDVYWSLTTPLTGADIRALMARAIEADRQQVRDYIEAREHPDDWGVPCIYTSRLRESLGMEPT